MSFLGLGSAGVNQAYIIIFIIDNVACMRTSGSYISRVSLDVGHPFMTAAPRSCRPLFNRGTCFHTRRRSQYTIIALKRVVPGSSGYGVNAGGEVGDDACARAFVRSCVRARVRACVQYT